MWRQAEHYQVVTGNELPKEDGTVLRTRPPLQRPEVFVKNGVPRVLTLAIPDGHDWYCVTISLKPVR